MIYGKTNSEVLRHNIIVNGIVQGVGFRPFVYRLAKNLSLTGSVRNTPFGVEIEIQGSKAILYRFRELLLSNHPPLAVIDSCRVSTVCNHQESDFTILPSSEGIADIQVAPDSALCQDCLRELFDPKDRRYRYPFITCTNCGPRYSIITGIPYDRPNTTMAGFRLCPACQAEYEEPNDRRFHAQPLACPECGPQLTLTDKEGKILAIKDAALNLSLRFISEGKIVAIKGLGGYHLAADACNHDAVKLLRLRKKRDEKPFALMVGDLKAARDFVFMTDLEERLLSSPESPIILLRSKDNPRLSELISPNNGWLGLMLPYTPLHHLLFRPISSENENMDFKRNCLPHNRLTTVLIMTSANNSHEPIIYEDNDAFERLSSISDAVLSHNRPIKTRSDDSVLRLFRGKPLFYRRSRGYAPRGITLPFATETQILAVGAEMKSSICITQGSRAAVSQYIGDLKNDETLQVFTETIDSLSSLLQAKPSIIVSDLHPDYLSTVYAAKSGLRHIAVQHHHAHLAACMAENRLEGQTIGLIFDGTGYGGDGTLWGGEVLVGGYDGFERAGHFRPVRLPGGDAAVQEPWRMALSYLYQSFGNIENTGKIAMQIKDDDRALLLAMLERGINAPLSTSCGRLFDAVAALIGVRQKISYDGQAAIELESLAEKEVLTTDYCYNFNILNISEAPFQIDFSQMIVEILQDLELGLSTSLIALRFHNTVAAASVAACLKCGENYSLNRVVLSGGVFQNKLLSEMLASGLEKNGFTVYTHRLVPPNDGCISLGQVAVVAAQFQRIKINSLF